MIHLKNEIFYIAIWLKLADSSLKCKRKSVILYFE